MGNDNGDDVKLYAERDICEQKYYYDHVLHMTSEGLRSKSAIAAELAHRDEVIDELSAALEDCKRGMSRCLLGDSGGDCYAAEVVELRAALEEAVALLREQMWCHAAPATHDSAVIFSELADRTDTLLKRHGGGEVTHD